MDVVATVAIAVVAAPMFYAAATFPGGEANLEIIQDGQSIELRLKSQPQADLDRFRPGGPYIELLSDSYVVRSTTSADSLLFGPLR